METMLNESQRAVFAEQGWLLLPGLCIEQLGSILGEIDRLSRPGAPDVLRHDERTSEGQVQLARLERLADASPLLGALMTDGVLARVAEELLGEPGSLFKDKANFKLAGGAGFSVHQDLPAYPGVSQVVSAMVARDASDEGNGCLECVSGAHHSVLEQDERGCVAEAVAAELVFLSVPMAPGDALFFHGLAPHRSAPNRSEHNRRALFPTWAPASEGDLRGAYYETKLATFAAGEAIGTKQISLIGDFEGELV